MGVIAGSPESLLAIRVAKQAVPALSIEGVTALQARNACGYLFASELCV
jgi:hypothetical protein